ncbi:peptidyl-prolyl cis-trans isomerase [Lysobacter antibioticus]|uniref:peptidyl-prolyl cis-trans isomerase n=1 Tax=Lysobacter antibioticus TaxID=84531 RepID=UPI0004D005BF|nr:peptidyl-prolyl cis-trans isomerase [Lysobacter antibioticus]
MLQTLRDKTSGWIATVILGLLIIPFAFVGIEQYLVQRVDSSVARIDMAPSWWRSAPSWWPASMLWKHESIDAQEFNTRFQQERDRRRAAEGEAFDAREFEKPESKRAILETLIDERVRKLAAEVDGLAVSDALVIKTIQAVPEFQDSTGKFNQERYVLGLQMRQPAQTPTEFEQFVRARLMETLLTGGIGQSNFLTHAETDRLIKLMGERRDVSLVMLPPPTPDTAEVSAADIQKWYDGHAKDFRAPESVNLEYVEINGATLPPPPLPTEKALQDRYEAEKSRFIAQEQRLISHIQVNVASGADAAAQKAAEQKAAQLATQAKAAGADFAAIARANSDDLGSKAAGGELGWVSKGDIPGAFEDAAFKLKVGEISAPVKDDSGWHVIVVREVKSGEQQPFALVRDALLREETETSRERNFNDFSAKLVDLVYKNPTSLDGPAKAMNLPVQKVGPVTRDAAANGQGIGAHPAVIRAAFSDARLQDNTVSDPIEIGQEHSVLIRVVSHTPERALPLAQVRDKVIAAVRTDRGIKAAQKEADALVARINGGEAIAAVAASKQLTAPETIPDVARGMPLPTPEVSEAIFALKAPAEGKVAAGKSALADGRVVLFAVNKVKPGSKSEIPAAQLDMLRTQISQMGGYEESRELTTALRKRVQIKVIEENLR